MCNKIMFLNIFIYFFYSVLDLLLINPNRCKNIFQILILKKIASSASQLGKFGLGPWVSYPTFLCDIGFDQNRVEVSSFLSEIV